nr:EOG090X04MD [Sida crystallina]
MDWLLFLVSFLHILICPYTKVEESFNLQAIHDILYYQSDIDKYDHLEFPGVVPRSFLGPLAVSGISAPFVATSRAFQMSKFASLLIVRCVLGCLVIWPLTRIRKRLEELLGDGLSSWFIFITLSQFHFIFYLSRPLPNTMALPLVLFAYDFWLSQQHSKFITCSAAAIIIFRGELAILLGLILIGELVSKRVTLANVLKVAVPSGLLYLSLTVLVDSFFWRTWLWPEGQVLWYNVYLNKSAEWGVSPYWWYFYSAIPRAMGSTIFWLPIGWFLERRVRSLMWPPLLFILAYSFLPHKELRFIIYVFPLFNIAAAAACSRVWENRGKGSWHGLLALGVVGHLAINLVLTCFLLAVSSANYPGGQVLSLLHEIENPTTNVTVHIDTLAAQTGVSRFGQLHDHWRYDKTEHLRPGGTELKTFTHLIVEGKNRHSFKIRAYSDTHEILEFVEGFSHIRSTYSHFPPIRIKSKPCLFILKNKYPPAEPDFSFTLVKTNEDDATSDQDDSTLQNIDSLRDARYLSDETDPHVLEDKNAASLSENGIKDQLMDDALNLLTDNQENDPLKTTADTLDKALIHQATI